MKKPVTFLTNTTTPAGRALGQANDDPGGGTGTGVDNEIYNDPAYGHLAVIESYKDGGNSDTDETTLASDMRDAIEELTDKRVTDSGTPANSIAEWEPATTYVLIGELLSWKGLQFVAYNVTGNLNKDPLTSPDFWHIAPKPDDLMMKFHSGQVLSGGLSPIADRAGGDYAQNIAFGRYRLGGNGDDFYNFFRVALDGTVVTGDTTLEDDIFHVGDANEYFNVDLVAPDVLGTRTLLDMGEYIPTPQSSGGDNDTIGDLNEDQFQGHWHYVARANGSTGIISQRAPTLKGILGGSEGYGFENAGSTVTDSLYAELELTNGVDGTPRTGTKTKGRRFTEGASYIIVMVIIV